MVVLAVFLFIQKFKHIYFYEIQKNNGRRDFSQNFQLREKLDFFRSTQYVYDSSFLCNLYSLVCPEGQFLRTDCPYITIIMQMQRKSQKTRIELAYFISLTYL